MNTSTQYALRARTPAPAGVILFVFILTGCAESGAAPAAFSVTDSAGVRVVTSHTPLWNDGEPWQVPHEPAVVFGSAALEAADIVADPVDATRLSDGRIVVADRGAAILHWYDSSGVLLHTVGRRGEGPGEFRYLFWVKRWAADTVAVSDATLRRLSLFTSDGRYVTSYGQQELGTLDGGPMSPFDDRSLLAVEPVRRGLLANEGPYDQVLNLHHVMPGSTATTPLGVQVRRRYYSQEHLPPQAPFLPIPVPFAPMTHYTASHGVLVVGESSTLGFDAYDHHGAHHLRARTAHDSVLVEEADREWVQHALMATSERPPTHRAIRRSWSKMDFPKHLPAFGRGVWELTPAPKPRAASILVDAERNVWLLSYATRGEPRPWLVFDSTGRWLGKVNVPDDLVPLEIGHDYVLGWAEDPDGLVVIRMHRLIKRRRLTSRE